MCKDIGDVTGASVVDHIKPHKGDYELFWDADNHQALCKPCHDRHKQRQDRTGVVPGFKPNGSPLDTQHHWNK
jgi:5-methylcytosine-specific restriction protein A